MADVTLDALTELTTIANDDYFAVFDASGAALKRISRTNLLANTFFTNVAQSVTAVTTFVGAVVLSRTDATIAAGVITVDTPYMRVDTEGGAASDDLTTINGGASGQILVIQTVNSGRDVTVVHGTGNIYLHGAANFTLNGTRDKLMLINQLGTEWNEIGRGDNV